jgi:hypothetical protein
VCAAPLHVALHALQGFGWIYCRGERGRHFDTREADNGLVGTVRVFRQKVALEDAIDSHACSLEAGMRVNNGIPLGCSHVLPVGNANRVQTLKVQLTLALNYMHERLVLHRDLKSNNIFLRRGIIKVGDFGIARVLQGTMELPTTFAGTPYYMSPECLQSKGYGAPPSLAGSPPWQPTASTCYTSHEGLQSKGCDALGVGMRLNRALLTLA